MDSFSKKVYKFLLSQPGYGFRTSMYDPDGFDKSSFIRVCEQLVTDGYARNFSGGYALTQKGVAKKELEFRSFWKACFTRYIPGVATGAAAAVIAEILIRSHL